MSDEISLFVIYGFLAVALFFVSVGLVNLVMTPYRIYVELTEDLRKRETEFQETSTAIQKAKKSTGRRVVEKQRGVNGAREMIQELIDALPSRERLDRKAVAQWAKRCYQTLQVLLADEQEDEWLKIVVAFFKVEDATVDTAPQVKESIEAAEIQLKALKIRFSESMLRTEARLTSGEYNDLYADQANIEELRREIENLKDKLKAASSKADNKCKVVASRMRKQADEGARFLDESSSDAAWAKQWHQATCEVLRDTNLPLDEFRAVCPQSRCGVCNDRSKQSKSKFYNPGIEWLRARADRLSVDDLDDEFRYGDG